MQSWWFIIYDTVAIKITTVTIEQGKFSVFWAPEKYNLADYFTKYHSIPTHRRLRPIYTYVEGQSPTSLQECIEILTNTNKPYQITTDRTSMQGTPATTNSNLRASQSPSYHLLDKLTNALKRKMMNRLE